MRIVLAFDIEKAGPSPSDPILAIGASVVNQDFKEMDSLFLPCYVPDKTVFDEKCWDEFWSKRIVTLKSLTYDGILTPFEREHDVVQKFQEFREKWETYCEENDIEYYLVSDTNAFDAGCINHLLHIHLSDEMPIPYSASKKEYSSFINVSDYQRGVLAVVDPEFSAYWGMTDKIEEMFEVPPKERDYDHNPTNDAYTIAYDFQILMGIKNRTVHLKHLPKSPTTCISKGDKRSNRYSMFGMNYLTYGAMAIAVGFVTTIFLRRR
jgi:hypothetical protein